MHAMEMVNCGPPRPGMHVQVDASTQADLVGYESEDERMGRRGTGVNKRSTPTPYSKVDIREQYCINRKEVQVLESNGPKALFGCLSKHHDSSCNKHAFLRCMDRAPSDENLQSLPRRPVDDLERAYLRKRPKSMCSTDPRRYNWIPEDEEFCRMENARPVAPDTELLLQRFEHSMTLSSEHLPNSTCPAHYLPPPPPPPASAHRTKHVSFARSHTLTSFDDAIMELRRTPTPVFKSQERLILSTQSGKRTGPPLYQTYEQRVTKRPPMKTQATQTGLVGREPPNYLSLSPRTVHRGAQTNGQLWNGRRLMKSYSAAGCQFGVEQLKESERGKEHDILMRTQSEEPRSPYMKTPSLPWPPEVCPRKELQRTRSSKMYKEIFIDFEPADGGKRSRQSYTTHSDGEFASDGEELIMEPVVDRVDGVKVSLSSYSSFQEEDPPHPEPAPRHLLLRAHDSVDEEFHENLVLQQMFQTQCSLVEQNHLQEVSRVKQNEILASSCSSPEHCTTGTIPIITNTLAVSSRASPFASSDSLTNDHRADHSDGIWNESQSTVLLAEPENGTFGRSSSSKKHLLLLHQQRSSIDTEALEDDFIHSQSSLFSPLKETTVPSVTIATVHHDSTSPSSIKEAPHLPKTHIPHVSLSPGKRELRRKLVKSPEKAEEVEVRRDSGRVTDISETSTTDDYATALDNSEASCRHQQGSKYDSKEGSSFESATSLPSFAKEEVPVRAISTPPIKEEREEKKSEEIEEVASLESSSSGSYSLESFQKEGKEWTDQEKTHMKKGFKLDLSDHSAEPEGDDVKQGGANHDVESSPKKAKPKSSSRKNQQGPVKKWSAKAVESIVPGMVRSPAMREGFRAEDWAPPQRSAPQTPEEGLPSKNGVDFSSDESSCEYKNTGIDETINGHSPRRQRKRGLGRARRGQDGSSRTRRPLVPPTSSQQQPQQLTPSNYCRSPSHSPRGSPRKTNKGTKQELKKKDGNPDSGVHLKALSAESLRSVSPGSDSVFYNEGDTHHLCHQCGRQVEPEAEKATAGPDIVQPPPRFADSPEGSRSTTYASVRLFKKQDKRFRSEERTGERRKHHRTRTEGLRAKSEERGKDRKSRDKLRPHAHSTDASLELLRGGDSSPSISDPFTEDEMHIYADNIKTASWLSILDEVRTRATTPVDEGGIALVAEEVQTPTEQDFQKRFQAITHRLVHRKSSFEMYCKQQTKAFRFLTLREKLEEVLQLMLLVWSTQTQALVALGTECDKRITVRRESKEKGFGFRIHGNKPIVVSAIEPDTPAENSGLEVGDILLKFNGASVLELSHSEVVNLASLGPDELLLELARTSAALMPAGREAPEAVLSGFLNKLGTDNVWHRRWFVLKTDNCLYYYNSQAESQPLGALLLINYTFTLLPEQNGVHSFLIEKHGARGLELNADTPEDLRQWKEAIETAAASETSRQGQWFDRSCRLLQQPAAAIEQPDCFGHLTKLEDKWRRRYCVLKDSALLLFTDSEAQKALGVICLQGYRVQSTGSSSASSSTKRFSFEIIPPEPKQKHFYFYTDSDLDKKRWIAAIEYSIDRWMKIS